MLMTLKLLSSAHISPELQLPLEITPDVPQGSTRHRKTGPDRHKLEETRDRRKPGKSRLEGARQGDSGLKGRKGDQVRRHSGSQEHQRWGLGSLWRERGLELEGRWLQ